MRQLTRVDGKAKRLRSLPRQAFGGVPLDAAYLNAAMSLLSFRLGLPEAQNPNVRTFRPFLEIQTAELITCPLKQVFLLCLRGTDSVVRLPILLRFTAVLLQW